MLGHLRIAHATDHLEEIVGFYREGLGFELVGEFSDHGGFDGVMLGNAGAVYRLENFTRERGRPATRTPDADNLLVLYLRDAGAF